jgi:UDP-N-acetylmuramate dehydrogenase
MLSELTTLGLGGPPSRFVEAATDDELVSAVRDADAAAEPVLVLAGGSNLVVADEGFAGLVVRVATTGVQRDGDVVHVAAGEPWDAFLARCVEHGRAGAECLSGIPGAIGATPIQNVGAYGQEVAETIVSVRAWDRPAGRIVDLAPEACGFSYRSSAFKREPGRHVVLRVSFRLEHSPVSGPIRYAELARSLGVTLGASAPLAEVREAVLALRRGKGMVLDPTDPDTRSAGSFFTNPVLTASEFAALQARSADAPPGWPEPDGRVKTSAAWLIEHAGFHRGDGDPAGIAISTKHVLALTNRGHGTAGELVALARRIAAGVRDAFGVSLVPEPVLVGLPWP